MKNVLPVFFVFFLAACAAAPPPPEDEPSGALAFQRIEAGEGGLGILYFSVLVQNPRSSGLVWTLDRGSLSVDGASFPGAYSLDFPEPISVASGGTAGSVLALNLDMRSLTELADNGGDSVALRLSVRALASYGGGTPFTITMNGEAAIPRCREPRFSITSIAVSQAELVNTRLKVGLKIENPNPFPVELASLAYELYGDGRFWADGSLQDILSIPPHGASEASVMLLMNFINMRRELLDQVIAMNQVRYRFRGDVLVSAPLEYLPSFPMSFDLSGNSPVVR